MHPVLRALAAVSVCACFGCSTLMFWEEKGAKPGADAAGSADETSNVSGAVADAGVIQPSTISELELKLARLYVKVDELEEKSFRQAEMLRVLQKGLELGLLPEELKMQQGGRKHQNPVSAKKDPISVKPVADPPAISQKQSPPAELSEAELKTYQEALARAHDHFRAGRYPQAIVDYTAIGERFANKAADGMPKYWIAKSWYQMKEYQTSYNYFNDFLKQHPGSPWAPRAKVDLAQAEIRLNLKEKARDRLRRIIDEYPYEEAAEMAKLVLRNLQKEI